MEAFINRLKKVNKHIAKWAKRNQIDAYRIYDWDIPEFPFCVDQYNNCLHVAEYASNKKLTPEESDAFITQALHAISDTLQIPIENIYLKQRRKLDRRNEQYEKVATQQERQIVQEQGLQFHINLSDYLDTGLFLDHRPLRNVFRSESKGKKVLNLFAYTGAFSVYAAAGGASQVTTVDLSNTYIQWAKDNFQLNNLDTSAHNFVVMDTMEFLKQLDPNESFDLIFVDPPVFSNSSKLKKGTWDTQRDHAAMLQILLQHTQPGGVIYFSNNLRTFVPNFQKLQAASIVDITAQTIPEDFRNKQIHWCWKIIK